MSKLAYVSFSSILNILRVIAIPTTVEFDERLS